MFWYQSIAFRFMYLFYFFTAIVIWLGILSLRRGLLFAKYVRLDVARLLADFTPVVSVIAPCRGLDQGLRQNIEALFQQDYPGYEVIFVSDRADDPALSVVEEVRRVWSSSRFPTTRVLIAGEASESGQKVHNLRFATDHIGPGTEVLVFVDTDARPHATWLRSLVAPLNDAAIGASTGYRWFVPVEGGFASHLRSIWNGSIAASLGKQDLKNFCWGGSTAIRRETFEKLQIRDRWRGTVSDDFTITRALHEERLPIHFVPACLVASLEDCSFPELLEFTTRQLKITRVYAPGLWKLAFVGSLLFSLVFFGGLVLVVGRAALGLPFMLPLLLLCVIFVLGAVNAMVRFRAICIPLARFREQLRRGWLPHLVFWPLASLIYLYNASNAAWSRKISWRGITYELKSPDKAVIIARER